MTDELVLLPACSLGLAEYAALFNAAYEGYLIPFHIEEDTVAAMREAFDLDADASRIAFRDGEAVGLGNLGIRGEDAWIGGVGVVTTARRTGVGETLMRALHEQARERCIRRVWLEVIVENTGAFALYEKLEEKILPLYYKDQNSFIEVMRHTIALNGAFFNTQRMVQQYVLSAYFQ